MINKRLFADLVDLYNENVKTFISSNTGLVIDKVLPLEIEQLEEIFPKDIEVDLDYIKTNFKGFTINPVAIDLEVKNEVHRTTIAPDISWEKQY